MRSQATGTPSEPDVIDHPDGVSVDGVFVPIDFKRLHASAEADEAAGRVFDHDEVMRSTRSYLVRLLEQQPPHDSA